MNELPFKINIFSLLLQIQQNKQNISSLKRKHTDSIDDLRPGEDKHRNNARWSNDELMLAVQVSKIFTETIGPLFVISHHL